MYVSACVCISLTKLVTVWHGIPAHNYRCITLHLFNIDIHFHSAFITSILSILFSKIRLFRKSTNIIRVNENKFDWSLNFIKSFAIKKKNDY